jgi:ribosomal protein S18 acetylase RimI-like enzyme
LLFAIGTHVSNKKFGEKTHRFFQYLKELSPIYTICKKLARKMVKYDVISPEDIYELSKFYVKASKQPTNDIERSLRQVINLKDRGHILKAILDNRIIGSVVLIRITEGESSPYPSGWWIFSLLVEERFRGLGIGEKLVRMALQKSKDKGAPEVKLMVDEDNKPAISLYNKVGFQENSNPKIDTLLAEKTNKGKSKRIFMTIRME